ncbi:MAG TPA: DUF4157 domain-containing protein [Lysobacter sp.]
MKSPEHQRRHAGSGKTAGAIAAQKRDDSLAQRAGNQSMQRLMGGAGQAGAAGRCEATQRTPTLPSAPATELPPVVHEVLASPGQPLESAKRRVFEQRFGHDFSRVRIHADAQAGVSARSVDAAAYTVGQHVVLGQARSRHTADAMHTLAHELAHVVQQDRGGSTPPHAVYDHPLESAADAAASAFMAGRGRVQVAGASAVGLVRQAVGGPGSAGAEPEDRVPVWRVENDDGTWTALNLRGEELYTGPLGPVVDPGLRDMHSVFAAETRDEDIRKRKTLAAYEKWAELEWTNPLLPIRSPESFDPGIYDLELLKRLAAQRLFDQYDQKEMRSNGVVYKKAGSGRVYANDIAEKDWKELVSRYSLKVSTDPDRVVLPMGAYEFEGIYEGKLLRKTMEDNNLPRELIHQVAMQIDREIVGGAYMGVAGLGTARIGNFRSAGSFRPVAPPLRTPGMFRRAYMKLRLSAGLAGQGVSRAGANPAIGAGGGTRPVAALHAPRVPVATTPPVVSTPRATVQAPRTRPPTPREAAIAFRASNPKLDSSAATLDGLEDIFRRTMSGKRTFTPRPGQYLPSHTRGAAGELAAIRQAQLDPTVTRIQVIPPQSGPGAQRTPDLTVEGPLPNVSISREIRTITGGRVGYQATGSRVQISTQPEAIANAIRAKIFPSGKPSQLAGGGDLVVQVRRGGPNVDTTIAQAVNTLNPRLVAARFLRELHFVLPGGRVVRYVRAPDGTFVVTP